MRKFLIFHPFLFAIYPVLFLFSHNIAQYRIEVLGYPLFLTLIFAGIVYLICFLIFRKLQEAAILASSFILMFFSYSRIQDQIINLYVNLAGFTLGPDKVLLIGALLILVLVIFLVIRFKNYLRTINKILNIISIVLVLFTLVNILIFEFKTGRIWTIQLDFGLSNEDQTKEEVLKPDIYYFVFDRYGGDKTLKLYGYDNSEFINYLKDKGFYIAERATSNYPKTFLSLGSSLNFGYVNHLTEKTNGGGTSDESIVTPLVKNNKVIKFLKKKGYKYIHVGSGWDPTRTNKNADINYILRGGVNPYQDEFSNGVLHTTLASPILKTLFPDTTAVSQNPKLNDHRSRVLYEFQTLEEIPSIPGPKFIFMHILLPHDPYVLDKNCTPISEEVTDKRSETQNYIDQLQCTNKLIEKMLNNILDKSETPPIIVLTADEGPRPQINKVPGKLSWVDASDESINEKFPILAAFYLPGFEENPLYPTITPVNNFRVIFNSYFGTKYPLLQDKNYIFQDEENYYKFIDVTDRIDVDRSLAPANK